MKHLITAALALAALAGCQVTPLFTIALGPPGAAASSPPQPPAGAPAAKAPAWTAATGGSTPVSAASPPNLAQAVFGKGFWQDDPVNQGFFYEEKFGPSLGIGQTFRLKQSGRVRAAYVWLGGEIDPAGVMFIFRTYKDSATGPGPVMARGTITEIAGPGPVEDARECRVTFVPPPAVVADTRYAFTADPMREGVVLKAFATKGYPYNKDEGALVYNGGWGVNPETDLKYSLDIEPEASATTK